MFSRHRHHPEMAELRQEKPAPAPAPRPSLGRAADRAFLLAMKVIGAAALMLAAWWVAVNFAPLYSIATAVIAFVGPVRCLFVVVVLLFAIGFLLAPRK
jgi:hypothetical protein